MPWSEVKPMDQKIQFVSLALNSTQSMTELCRLFGVSRKTGYKWLDRYHEHGIDGLKDRCRAPHHIPHRTPQKVIDFVINQRKKHPTWGGRKIAQKARKVAPDLDLPSETTLQHFIRQAGLVKARSRRRQSSHPGPPLTRPQAPNDVWTVDFKGEFKTKDGLYCYPLTILDEHSRFLLACRGLRSTGYQGAFRTFRRVFEDYGLPAAIKSDNGIPFATTGLCRLSMLSVWWIKLGIYPVLIEPGRPDQNGRHERMHRTLKKESTLPALGNLSAQQRRFNAWRDEYNLARPHEALNGNYPEEVYRPSGKAYPAKIAPVEYPDHYEVRRVTHCRCMKWHGHWIPVSSALKHEYVGLEEIDDGLWAVYFSWKRIGFLDEKKKRILDDAGRSAKRAK
jgi:putative transposase